MRPRSTVRPIPRRSLTPQGSPTALDPSRHPGSRRVRLADPECAEAPAAGRRRLKARPFRFPVRTLEPSQRILKSRIQRTCTALMSPSPGCPGRSAESQQVTDPNAGGRDAAISDPVSAEGPIKGEGRHSCAPRCASTTRVPSRRSEPSWRIRMRWPCWPWHRRPSKANGCHSLEMRLGGPIRSSAASASNFTPQHGSEVPAGSGAQVERHNRRGTSSARNELADHAEVGTGRLFPCGNGKV
jgi:hypothetical protein